MKNITCILSGHKWKNEYGGYTIQTWDGASVCNRCGYTEIRGDDPASLFDYHNGPDSWGVLKSRDK